MTVTLDTIIRRHPDQISSEMDGQTVLMTISTGLYFGLNAVGSDIWRQLDAPKSVGDLVTDVVARYDVDEASCRADILALVEQLVEHQLVQVG
ncbi:MULTISPECIES: PqqD family peptide modification chaperone [unclassified Sphingomonas]|uniref:PqqD family peptide modification chaperone n=1 Tax=unclassified Sphingomonas TaxID=196159 RepID=UPI000AD50AC2|nr:MULTISPECIES: PqqD family peptide modification chaperone [unclassified Sphingomonas]